MIINILIVFVSILATALLWAIVKINKMEKWLQEFFYELEKEQARAELQAMIKILIEESEKEE